MTLDQAQKLPNGTVVRWVYKGTGFAAKHGATAKVKHELIHQEINDPSISPHLYLYVEWIIQNELYNGQRDGGYSPSSFELAIKECNCDLNRLMIRGCGCGGV